MEIIIMSCRQHGYPWPSLATSPYHSSPLAGLQGYIIIIISCRHHGYPWPSLATSPYHSSALAGLQGYIIIIISFRHHGYPWPSLATFPYHSSPRADLQGYIIIMSCYQHGYPWSSLATSPYRSSPLAGLQGYIPYPHITAVCIFELVVLLLLGHMWGSIGLHHLWAPPCFLQQCPACLVRPTLVMGGRWPYSWCFVGCCR